MAVFILNKRDTEKHPDFEKLASELIKNRIETDLHISYEPKPGFLATFGVLLTEKGISYQLEFEPPQRS